MKYGYRCAIRPHPRLTNIKDLREVFNNTCIEIEDISKVNLSKSLGRTKYIVSKYSTVLTEARENELLAVIDDLSNPQVYEYLKKTMYINLDLIPLRLSKIIKELGNGNGLL